MRRALTLCQITAVACVLAGPIAAQSSQALSPDQMRDFATQLLSDGDAPRAIAVTEILLSRNPEDVGALIVRAQAGLLISEYDIALDAARVAYQASAQPTAKFVAARLAARAHAEQNEDTRAQLWLRRARQFAPTTEAAADVASDFRFLRNRNPWSTQLRFGVRPSNNVNNGSSSETFRLLGTLEAALNNEARALSGLAFNGGFTSSYRLNTTPSSVTFVDVAFDGTTFLLSPQANAGLAEDRLNQNLAIADDCAASLFTGTAPILTLGEDGVTSDQPEPETDSDDNPPCDFNTDPLSTGSTYSFATLSFGLSHRVVLRADARPTNLNLRYGQVWYGGDPYSRFLTLGATQTWDLGDDSRLLAGITIGKREYEADQPGSKSYGLRGSWTTILNNDNRLELSAAVKRSISDAPSSHFREAQISARYDLAAPINGIDFGFSTTVERVYDYPFFSLFGAARVDNTAAARVDAQFRDYEYFGFRPVVSLEASVTESNIDRYDQENLSLSFDLRSAF